MVRLKLLLLPISKKEKKSQFLTGKSFSEAPIVLSTNTNYDKSLFIELPSQHMKTTSTEHGQNMANKCF